MAAVWCCSVGSFGFYLLDEVASESHYFIAIGIELYGME